MLGSAVYSQLRNLWFTRLPKPWYPLSDGLASAIHLRVEERGQHIAVCSNGAVALAQSRELVGLGLWHRAFADGQPAADNAARDITGWLVVDVPMPHEASPAQLMHRMIRRLYFASVLHGLAQVPQYREAVQGLRVSYLQTRGKVKSGTRETSAKKGTGEVGVGLDPLKLTAKLTAGEELTVAEELAAEMERLDVFEAEDQLVYDLQLLIELEGLVTTHGELVKQYVPRWEQVRNFFQAQYARFLKPNHRFRLRPLFVLEVLSAAEVVTLMELLSVGAGLLRSHSAQLLLIGNQVLGQAIQADERLGHPVFRNQFKCYTPATVAPLAGSSRELVKTLSELEEGPTDTVRAVLKEMLLAGGTAAGGT